MKSTVKTVKGRGRPRGSKNKSDNQMVKGIMVCTIDQLEKDLERKDHTLEIMRDEIRELEKYLADQKEKNAFLELDIGHLKDIIKRLVEHL
jgi:hypothetical protein